MSVCSQGCLHADVRARPEQWTQVPATTKPENGAGFEGLHVWKKQMMFKIISVAHGVPFCLHKYCPSLPRSASNKNWTGGRRTEREEKQESEHWELEVPWISLQQRGVDGGRGSGGWLSCIMQVWVCEADRSWFKARWREGCSGRDHVWCTSWNISSRGIRVSGPYSLEARRSNAATFCFTTSSKNMVANWEWSRERNSKDICAKDKTEGFPVRAASRKRSHKIQLQ